MFKRRGEEFEGQPETLNPTSSTPQRLFGKGDHVGSVLLHRGLDTPKEL